MLDLIISLKYLRDKCFINRTPRIKKSYSPEKYTSVQGCGEDIVFNQHSTVRLAPAFDIDLIPRPFLKLGKGKGCG